ncbi:MAG: phosphonate ABC transporter, permease protein PhnE [Candidatus Omnitrophica bacterium]|nr:phosphonate ABC transporter, permease protein PhnE [Candidatus Omnitrophota bacterium]
MSKRFPTGAGIVIIVAILSVASFINLGLLDVSRWGLAFRNLAIFSRELSPPRWDILPVLLPAIWETIQISFAGTILGFLLSLPLAFLGTHTLFNQLITTVARGLVGAIRTVPSILFGIIFVIAVGLGPKAGVLGVALYTVGYLAKIYYEAFEAVDGEVIEAVRSTGCNRLQLFRFAILPETFNTLISQLLFMFEYNIRASTIMGFVGAGGIGYYLVGYVQMLQYQHLMMAIILIFVVIMAIDLVSFRIRARISAPRY